MSQPSIVITDANLGPDGPKILFVNPEFQQMTGYAASELIGRQPHMLQGLKTSRAELIALRRALKAGIPHRTVLVNYRKNGEPYLCDIEIQPIVGADGQVHCFLGIEFETQRKPGRHPARPVPTPG